MRLIVLEGAVVTVLVLTGLREIIMHAIPLELKKAIAIGIGLFIAFIGFNNSGIVVKAPSPDVPVTLAAPDHLAGARHHFRTGADDRPARAALPRRPARRNHR
jgi:AGZA family xanthine/uracil permease-like MFS transporter